MFWPNCLACGALGQELLNLYYPKGAILSQKLLNRELLNYPLPVSERIYTFESKISRIRSS